MRSIIKTILLFSIIIDMSQALVLTNSGFEEPVIPAQSYKIVDESTVPGWETTADDDKIEIWSDGFHGVPAYEGNQFAEINANKIAGLYQDINTTPDTNISWSIVHRGRSGTDHAGVYIGSAGGTLTKVTDMITDNTSWIIYNGTYQVPTGQTQTRIEFRAISTASGNDSVGNFIDDFIVQVGDIIAYPNEYELNTADNSQITGNVITDTPEDYGQNLSIDSNTNPSHGALTLNNDGSFTYIPDTGWTGTDNFEYTLTDGYSTMTTTVTLNMYETKANDDYALTQQDTDVSGNVMDNDTGSGLSVISNTNPSNGTLSGVNTDGTYTYTPNTGYSGSDSFEYTISDGNGNTSTATVYIIIEEPIVLPENLVAEYRLDECGFDGTTGDVIDNMINRLNGTTINGTSSTTGEICKGASFDGSNDYIIVPDNDKFDFDQDVGFTVSVWVYVTGDNDGVYVSKMSGTGWNGDDGWDLEIYNGRIYFDINGWDDYAQASKPSANAWHHIVGVYKHNNGNKEIILYVDGAEADSEDYNKNFRNATDDDLTIGYGGTNGYQEYYQGSLDEIKIWDRALSAQEVTDM